MSRTANVEQQDHVNNTRPQYYNHTSIWIQGNKRDVIDNRVNIQPKKSPNSSLDRKGMTASKQGLGLGREDQT